MPESLVELKEHPIMITLRDAISGDGFLAGITLSGRALIRQEEGNWWMYGVRPAAIAESGTTLDETFLRFRNRYKAVLFDIAQQSKTFEDFKVAVENFYNEADADNEDERLWEQALNVIRRAGNCPPPEPFASLPREIPESKPSQIAVVRLDMQGARFMPSDNVTDTYSVPMAQAA